jgi:ABC-type transporter Mla subunit MlaD
MLQKMHGDPADILQNVRWQHRLYDQTPQLGELACANALLDQSAQFIDSYGSGSAADQDYPQLLGGLLPCLRQTAQALHRAGVELDTFVDDIQTALQVPQALATLQNTHHAYLTTLQTLQT